MNRSSVVFLCILTLVLSAFAYAELAQKQVQQNVSPAAPKGGQTSVVRNPKGFIPEVFKTSDGRQGWKLHLPENKPLATPAYWNGMIFVGGGFGSYEFYALDAATGKVVWKFHTGDDGPTAAVVKDGYCGFNTESCILYILKARTGELVWQKWLGDPLMSQPAIENGRVYMAYPGSDGNHYLACMGLEDGKDLWKQPITGELITAPVVDNGSVYATVLDGTVYRFDAASGKLLWSDKKNATSAPMVYDGQVYLSLREAAQEGKTTVQYEGLAHMENAQGKQMNKDLWARQKADYLNVDKTSRYAAAQKAADASVGFSSAPAAAKLHQAEGNLGVSSVSGVWAYQGSRPMIQKGNSYQALGDNLQCMDAKSGKKLWDQKYVPKDKNAGGRALTPPSLTEKKLFVGSSEGEVLAYNLSDGKPLWSYQVKEAIRFQPAVAKGQVFFTTDNGTIYGIETGDSSDDGWYMWGGNASHNGQAK